ncbi:TIGR03086 family metal-binding protein [Luteipulveratus mongoliensis]|uniref:Mycothiol-dependent maleylpyruvate isomerase metal-binding domain-containing protein n=1 Tax=Luteipulveratus mongoliensis TaxID=571913 RepID=A0A0K1JGZ0_9MICO|nr:TIGR03086 family metal-binding protein [Luteipulveratus mongoliensis]AKU15979.1 hypothetical protein VV02_09125 [Luteipulveratus mongoliensis]
MTERPSLRHATELVSHLVQQTDDHQLSAPTPCPDYQVGDLLDHLAGLSTAFTWAAQKTNLEVMDGPPPLGRTEHLADDWKAVIPHRLKSLADAWEDPDAWTGMTKAGGIEMPGEVGGLVALNEVLVHGWDLAKGTGQAYDPHPELVAIGAEFTAQFDPAGSPGAFGPMVQTPDDGAGLQRLLGNTGRDIGWQPQP